MDNFSLVQSLESVTLWPSLTSWVPFKQKHEYMLRKLRNASLVAGPVTSFAQENASVTKIRRLPAGEVMIRPQLSAEQHRFTLP